MMKTSNNYNHIRTMKQLNMQLRVLRRESERSKDMLRKDVEYACWYYDPSRIVKEIGNYLKSYVMRFFKIMFILSGISVFIASCDKNKEAEFKYSVDEFADIEVLRYMVPEWENFTLQQKEYIYHLSEASKAGRDIIWDQNFKENLKVRKVIEKILQDYKGDKNTSEYKDFLVYAKRVFFSNGIHHHYADDKIIPACTQSYFNNLLQDVGLEDKSKEIVNIIYNPEFYPTRKYQGNDKDMVTASAVNFYDGVTAAEATAFYNAMENPKDTAPISYGLNSRLIKRGDGKIEEERYKIGGLYGPALDVISEHLNKAAAVAENDSQKKYISELVEYYKSGDLKMWDQCNITWVQDAVSEIDFVNGFIESYGDPLGMKATWEAIVNYKDNVASERTNKISSNAQWFENNSPVDPRFRKKEVKGVSAKVINVACIAGDSYPATAIGINLPNSNWIRKDYGSKSVTISNITEAYDKSSNEKPKSMLTEFAWDQAEIDLIKKYGYIMGNLHTDLHECLGHGSGQLLEGVSPNALKEFSSPLEEVRADLFALYYIADPKMQELGIIDDPQAYKAEYINYIRNGIFTQFARVELGKTNTQAHMQCRKLIADWCFDNGRQANIIEKKTRDGKTYFVINDFNALRGLFGQLLAEIQRIKSEGDYKAGAELMRKYAIDIDPVLHKEIKERYADLGLKPYRGFVNPDIVPVEKGGKIIDYKIVYCDDFLSQQLDYGKKYATLPVTL